MSDSPYFDNKVIWITGASSGIGEALAIACSQRGARLVLSARRQAELERVRSQCANAEAHLVLPLDLTNFDAVAATAQVLEQFGQIDILVNNGGVSQRGAALETGLEVDRRIMEINYFGAVALTKAVLPSMIARRSGCIVAISSLSGKISTPRRSAYAASKHALHGFFDALRAEVHKEGVGVLLVCPGYVRTNLSLHALTGAGQAHGKLDPTQEKGIAPAVLAEKILAAVEQGKDEVLIGGKEVLAVYLKRLWPGLYNWFIRRREIT
ncbi:MAG: SDR family oxidoreductase [Caldilineaceae bacterium]